MKKSALFISALALAAALTASLAGCQAQKSPEQLIKEDLSAQFDEVKSADSAAWSEEFGMDDTDFADLGIDSGTFMAGYLDGFDYEINEVTVDKDKGTATAKVDVTCKKFDEIFAAWFGDYMGKAMSMLNAPEEEITNADEHREQHHCQDHLLRAYLHEGLRRQMGCRRKDLQGRDLSRHGP